MTSSIGGMSNPLNSTPGKVLLLPTTPYKIKQAMQNQTRVIKGPDAERNLSNLKKPMVFQCQQCKVIIGNSNQLKQWKRLKDNSFLIFEALDRKTINISKNITTEMKGSFCYCSYRSILCSNCNSKIGMYFISTTSANQQFLKNFTIIEQSVIRYDLGDTVQVESISNPGSNSKHEFVDNNQKGMKQQQSLKLQHLEDDMFENAQNYNVINLPEVKRSLGQAGSVDEEVKMALLQQNKKIIREEGQLFRENKQSANNIADDGELYDKMTNKIDYLKDWVGKFNDKLDLSEKEIKKYFQQF